MVEKVVENVDIEIRCTPYSQSALIQLVINGEFDFKIAVRYMYETIFDVAPKYREVKEYKILDIL